MKVRPREGVAVVAGGVDECGHEGEEEDTEERRRRGSFWRCCWREKKKHLRIGRRAIMIEGGSH